MRFYEGTASAAVWAVANGRARKRTKSKSIRQVFAKQSPNGIDSTKKSEPLLANIGAEVVDNAADYIAARFSLRQFTYKSSVELCPESGVSIPFAVVSSLEAGTGFSLNLDKGVAALQGLSDQKCANILRDGQWALGGLGNTGPIHAHERQKQSGRIYSSKPAIVNLPKPLRVVLQPINGSCVDSVDYRNFELRVLFSAAGIEAPPGDCATYIGDAMGLSRTAVKNVVNPWLHGQTRGNLFGAKKRNILQDRDKVEGFHQNRVTFAVANTRIFER